MRAMEALETRCVRSAAARWPHDVREDMAAEWGAELHALRRDTSVGAWRRLWQRLSFVVSLAALPPYRGRQESGFTVPRLNVLGRRCVMLIAVGALCVFVQAGPGIVHRAPLMGLAANIVATLVVVLATIALAALGYWLGARRPVTLKPEGRFDRPATAAVAMVCVVAVVAVMISRYGDGTVIEWLMYPVWLAPFLLLATHVMRLAANGRTLAAWSWGIGTGLLLSELLTIPLGIGYAIHNGASMSQVNLTDAPLWFVNALNGEHGAWFAQGMVIDDPQLMAASGLATVLPALLPATAFLMTYLPRSARAPQPATPQNRTATATTAVGVPPIRKYAGLTTCALAVIAWSAVTTFLTPIADQVGHEAPAAWARELRLAAIVLAAVALAWALLGQVAAMLPAVGLGLGLVVADIAADRWQLTGTGAFLLLAAAGGALIVGTWWLATTLDKTTPDATMRRRGLTGLAILAAYCAPAFQWQADSLTSGFESEGFATPVALPITTTVLMIALMTVALSVANAARNHPLSPVGLAAVCIVPALLLTGTGILTWIGIPTIPDGIGALLGLPLSVYTLAVITLASKPSPGRVLKWTALALAALPVGLAAAYLAAIITEFYGGFLLSLHGPHSSELVIGSPVLLMSVVPLAAIGAILVARKVEPRPARADHADRSRVGSPVPADG